MSTPEQTAPRPKKIAIIAHGEIGNQLWEDLVKNGAADEIVVWNRETPTVATLPEEKPKDKFETNEYILAQLRLDQAAIIGARRKKDGRTTRFRFTHDIQDALSGAEIVAVTGGIPRGKGMDRKDLLQANCTKFIDPFAKSAKEFAPNASYIIATNPVDAMTQRFHKASGIPSDQIVGLSGELDYARLMQTICFTLHVDPSRVKNAYVIGQHADAMLPALSNISIVQDDGSEKKLTEYPEEYLKIMKDNTINGGARLIGFGKKSDYMGPAAALEQMIGLIVKSKGKEGKSENLQCSCIRQAEGEPDVFIGRTAHYENGKIVVDPIDQFLGKLSASEKAAWKKSVQACQKEVGVLPALEGKHASQVTASKAEDKGVRIG